MSDLTYLLKPKLVLLSSAVLLPLISVGISATSSPFDFLSNVQTLLFLS